MSPFPLPKGTKKSHPPKAMCSAAFRSAVTREATGNWCRAPRRYGELEFLSGRQNVPVAPGEGFVGRWRIHLDDVCHFQPSAQQKPEPIRHAKVEACLTLHPTRGRSIGRT